jgi:hypothetical protein
MELLFSVYPAVILSIAGSSWHYPRDRTNTRVAIVFISYKGMFGVGFISLFFWNFFIFILN